MEEAIIGLLLAASGVAALAGARVFPGTRPQAAALPAIVINKISAAPSYSDDGEDGIREDRVQIDCWGETYTAAKNTARAVIATLSAFQGESASVNIRYITLDLEHDLRETGGNAADYPFRTSLDFNVIYDN